jgi:hypothetical protein
MTYRPGDRVTITNPHPENAASRGKTGTIREIDNNGMYVLTGIDRPIREKLLGYVGCTADELTRA